MAGISFPTEQELKEALAAGAPVVDIRPPTSDEALEGKLTRINGALSAPWDRENGAFLSMSALGDHPLDSPIVLYCKTGNRVSKAEVMLREAGYTRLINGGGPKGPEALWQTLVAERGANVHEMGTFLQLFDEGGSSTLTYALADTATKEAIIIDPVLAQVDRDLAEVEKLGCKLTIALNTHCHADHITGTGALKAKVPGLKSAILGASGAKADMMLEPNQSVDWAGGTRSLKVVPTPGHTGGCVSYYDATIGAIFTGDALLIGGCGRTDFQSGDAGTLYDSVHNQIFSLPEGTLVYPAHDCTRQRIPTCDHLKAPEAELYTAAWRQTRSSRVS